MREWPLELGTCRRGVVGNSLGLGPDGYPRYVSVFRKIWTSETQVVEMIIPRNGSEIGQEARAEKKWDDIGVSGEQGEGQAIRI